MGDCARKALATPVTASVVPGPAVTTATPAAPVVRVPGVSGMGGGLLVPHIDDLDSFIDAAGINVDDMAAAEGKNRCHTLGL